MQGAKMIRLNLEDGAIELLGLVQPPGAVARHGQIEGLRRSSRTRLPSFGFCLTHVVSQPKRSKSCKLL